MATLTEGKQPRYRVLRALASGPARLVVGVVIMVTVAVILGRSIAASTIVIPVPIEDTSTRQRLPKSSERLIAVLQSDSLTPEYVSAIQRITERAEKTTGVTRVSSVTNTLVLIKTPDFGAGATAPLGPASILPLEVTLPDRARMASEGRLGSGDLISADGRTAAIVAELQQSLTPEQRDEAAAQFRAAVQSEADAAGIGITSSVAGDTYTTIAATEGLRSDYVTLVLLAFVAPAAIALLLLRRRVPVAAVLAAGGAALLLASALFVNTIGTDTGALPLDHPVATANRLVDDQLQGVIPVEIEFAGAPGDFRKPEVLARIDALANWLRDEYDVKATGLASTIRDETGVVTGVDSVPPNPVDLDRLLEDTATFDDGKFLPAIVTEDYSRTRMIGSWPSHSADAAASLSAHFDTIASAELADTGIAARLTAKVPTVEPATEALANALAILGAVALTLAAVLGLIGTWARHAIDVHERQEARLAEDAPDDDEDAASLFAREHPELARTGAARDPGG